MSHFKQVGPRARATGRGFSWRRYPIMKGKGRGHTGGVLGLITNVLKKELSGRQNVGRQSMGNKGDI